MFIIKAKFYNKNYYLGNIEKDGSITWTIIKKSVKEFDTIEDAQKIIDNHKITNVTIIEK